MRTFKLFSALLFILLFTSIDLQAQCAPDVTPPVITCPADITVNTDANSCATLLNYVDVTADDNCANAGVEVVYGNDSPPLANQSSNMRASELVFTPVNSGFIQSITLQASNSFNFTMSVSLIIRDAGGDAFSTEACGPAVILGTSETKTMLGNSVFAFTTWDFSTPVQVTAGVPVYIGPNINLSVQQATIGDDPTLGSYSFIACSEVSGDYRAQITVIEGGGGPVVLEQIAGLPSGSIFQMGTTTNTFRATDAAGNTADCSFDVTVNTIPQLAEQNCSGCGLIRVVACPNSPGLNDIIQGGNANYVSGYSIQWYEDNNGSQGAPIASPPTINTSNPGTDFFYWASQFTPFGCEGLPIRVQVSVDTDLNMNDICDSFEAPEPQNAQVIPVLPGDTYQVTWTRPTDDCYVIDVVWGSGSVVDVNIIDNFSTGNDIGEPCSSAVPGAWPTNYYLNGLSDETDYWVKIRKRRSDCAGTGATTCQGPETVHLWQEFFFTTPGCLCGDGYIADCEECDDGNTTNGDGCDASCQSEIAPPSCLEPTSLTCNGVTANTITASWTDNNGGNATYEIEIGIAGFTPSGTLNLASVSASRLIQGLPSDTSFDIYVRADCGGTFSGWVGPLTCSTLDPCASDTEPPTITCPADITVNNDTGQCGAVVTYDSPTVTDNCPAPSCVEVIVAPQVPLNDDCELFTATFTGPDGFSEILGGPGYVCGQEYCLAPGVYSVNIITDNTFFGLPGFFIGSGGMTFDYVNAPGGSFTVGPIPNTPVPVSETFSYTGDMQTWTVPAGVTSVNIEAWGAQGGFGLDAAFGNVEGGKGGQASGDHLVSPGDILYVFVGGNGDLELSSIPNDDEFHSGPGGFNGGGDGNALKNLSGELRAHAGGGGGASDVRHGGAGLQDRFIVAGGGGGSMYAFGPDVGGDGGGLIGENGDNNSSNPNLNGLGGTQTAGGIGVGFAPNGFLGLGGNGTTSDRSAGGGGGYYGGGAGDAAGGGSAYIDGLTNASTTSGVRSGDGMVTITYTPSALVCSPPSGSVFPVGTTAVNCTATDASGNTSTCSFDVTVNDNEDPNLNCTNTTLNLSSAGTTILDPISVLSGVSDNCSLPFLSVSPNQFDCSQVGTVQTVTLSGTEVNGNTGTCSAQVTIEDPSGFCCAGPEVICKPTTVQLDGSGNALLVTDSVLVSYTALCGLAGISVSSSSFTCADVGPNTVTLTVTDINGATSSCTSTVTVTDTISPTITCPDEIVIATDPGLCGAEVTVLSPAFSDNCSGTATNVINDPSFELGTPNSAWTESSTNFGTPVCDTTSCGTGAGTGPRTGDFWSWFGGIATFEEASISQDVVIPTSATELSFWLENVTADSPSDYLELLIDGNQEFIYNAVSPALGYSQEVVDISAYADGLVHSIEFHSEIFGTNGNTSNFFIDDIAIEFLSPILLTNNITGTDDASGFYDVGTTEVVWTATDAAGNTASCSFDITVTDNEAPVISNCPTTLNDGVVGTTCLNSTPDYSPFVTVIDNCDPNPSIEQFPPTGTQLSVGAFEIKLVATDASGNVSDTCRFTLNNTDISLRLSTALPSILIGILTRVNAASRCLAPASTLASMITAQRVFPMTLTTVLHLLEKTSQWELHQ